MRGDRSTGRPSFSACIEARSIDGCAAIETDARLTANSRSRKSEFCRFFWREFGRCAPGVSCSVAKLRQPSHWGPERLRFLGNWAAFASQECLALVRQAELSLVKRAYSPVWLRQKPTLAPIGHFDLGMSIAR